MFLFEEGHLVIVVFVVLAFISHHYLIKDSINRSIYLLMAAAVLVKIFFSADLYLHMWDERFHALVAKNIWSHPLKPMLFENNILPVNGDWSLQPIWLHKQPLATWIMGLSISLFGVNEWAVRIPSILMHLGIVFFVFKIGQRMFNHRAGWWSALIYSILFVPNSMSSGFMHTDHVDTCFAFFITASVYIGIVAVDKNRLGGFIFSGSLMGLAVLSKWLPGLIVLVFMAPYLITNREIKGFKKAAYLLLMILVAAIVAAPWQIYIFSAFPNEAFTEYNYNLRHMNEALEGHDKPWYFHIEMAVRNFTILIFVLIPLFMFYSLKDKMGWKVVALVGYVMVTFIFFTIAKTKLIGYTAIVFPGIAIMLGYLAARFTTAMHSLWPRVVLVALMVLMAIQNLDYLKLNDTRARKKKWCESQKKLAQSSRENQLVIFDDPHYVEAMFYIDRCTAYPYKVDVAVMDSLNRAGYKVMLFDWATETYKEAP